MTTVWIGNAAPLMADGSRAEIGNTITVVEMREGWNDHDETALALSTGNDPMLNVIGRLLAKADRDYAIGVLEVQQLWGQAHSGDQPEWIESDDEGFARVLANFFSGPDLAIPTQRPADWDASLSPQVLAALDAMTPAGAPPAGGVKLRPPMGGGGLGTEYAPDCFSEEFRHAWRTYELITTVGRDGLHAQHLGTAAQPAAFNYMGVSANATAESAASTTLPGEITTAGGGLLRAQATYAHTASTTTSTLTKTFTANGSDTLPVTIAKIGVLNAVTVGTLGYEKLLTSTATLAASGDNVAITFTLTAS